MASEGFPVARIDEYAKLCEPAIHVLRSVVPMRRNSGSGVFEIPVRSDTPPYLIENQGLRASSL